MLRSVDAATPASDLEVLRIIALARDHLEMDVAFVSEFTGGKQVYRAVDGDPQSFGIEVGDGPALEGTYCQRLVAGVIPAAIGDAAANPHVADLHVTSEKGIGAYVGVPLRFSDGEVYGTFCCLSHNADPLLSERDSRFMALLAELLAERLEQFELRRRSRARLIDVIDRRDFNTALQPVVSLATGKLVGAEALTRFKQPLGTPDIVFAQGHDLGTGVELEQAAFEAAHTLASHLPLDAYLAANLSPSALMHPAMRAAFDLVDDPSRCVLELTEHVSVEQYGALAATLNQLRTRGFRLAVDDVGAGYASFHHVLELNPDIIKIDRSLISGAGRDGARRRIITSIVLLAMDLGASVVAEGVEQLDDLAAVTDLGVDAVQGYLLGRPTTDRDAVRSWTQPWELGALRRSASPSSSRAALGHVLRELRGDRRQVDVLREVNEQLAALGVGARISQGQYSAYENGRQRPLPIRLQAIEAVFGLEPGALADMVEPGPIDADPVYRDGGSEKTTIAARLAQRRRNSSGGGT